MAQPAVIVREARPDEFEAIGRLYERSWVEFADAVGQDTWGRMRSNFARLAERAAYSEILVAERGGAIAGAVTYTGPDARPVEQPGPLRLIPRDWAYVGILAVAPERRGIGIGRALTGACVERARRDGAPTIGLGTRPPMAAARRLYDRMGFRRRPDLEEGQGEYLIYELPLTAAPTDESMESSEA